MTVTIAYTFAASSVSNPLAYLDTNFGQCVLWSGPTGTAQMPYGTTGQRDATPFIGIRYNTTLSIWEGYNGTTWGGLGTFGGGTVINPITAPGLTANTLAGMAFFDGSSFTNAASIQGASKNVHVYGPGTSAAVTVSADSIIAKNSSNTYANLSGISLTANTGAASGTINSLDTGAWAYSTWYNVFVVNGSGGTGLLFSLSATAPTLPTGYTYFARAGAIRTQSASYNPFGFAWNQYGRKMQYVSNAGGYYPVMSSGAAGTVNSTTTTWVAVGVSGFVPPTASRINVLGSTSSGGGYIFAAPNNTQTGGYGSTTQPILSNINSVSGVTTAVAAEFTLESANIYWASLSGFNILFCTGYEDNL